MSEQDILLSIQKGELKYINGTTRMNYSCEHVCTNGSTFFTWAVRKADVSTIKEMIRLKSTFLNHKERGGATPLLLAIHLNRFDVVKLLLTSGASIKERDSYDTPLTLAVRLGHLETVEFLIEHGADSKACDVLGLPPLIKAITETKLDIVDLFLSKKVGLEAVDDDGNTPLVAAIRHNTPKNVIERLLIHGDPNETKNEKTPLAWASELGNLEAVKLLIDRGAKINSLGEDGNTALAAAVKHQQSEIAKFLTKNRANICKVGEKGLTPLMFAVLNQDLEMIKFLLDHGADYIVDTVFLDAIATKNLEVVQLLQERGAQIRKDPEMGLESPLDRALQVGTVEIAKFLLEKGASTVEDLDKKEVSRIIQFLDDQNFEMVKLLVENGARLDEKSECGLTLLTKAVHMGSFDMVKYLLAQGANVDRVDGDGSTPLVVAKMNDDFQIFEYLVDCGAKLTEEDQAKFPKLARYYRLAKESSARRGKLGRDFGSNQEEA